MAGKSNQSVSMELAIRSLLVNCMYLVARCIDYGCSVRFVEPPDKALPPEGTNVPLTSPMRMPVSPHAHRLLKLGLKHGRRTQDQYFCGAI